MPAGGWSYSNAGGWPVTLESAEILAALAGYPDEASDPVLRSGCQWLLGRQDKRGSWSLWVRNTKLANDGPCPAITSQAITALHEAGYPDDHPAISSAAGWLLSPAASGRHLREPLVPRLHLRHRGGGRRAGPGRPPPSTRSSSGRFAGWCDNQLAGRLMGPGHRIVDVAGRDRFGGGDRLGGAGPAGGRRRRGRPGRDRPRGGLAGGGRAAGRQLATHPGLQLHPAPHALSERRDHPGGGVAGARRLPAGRSIAPARRRRTMR